MDPELLAKIERAKASGKLSPEQIAKLDSYVQSQQPAAEPEALPDPSGWPDTPTLAKPIDQPGGILPEIGRKIVSPLMTAAEKYTGAASAEIAPSLAEAADPEYAARAAAREKENPLSAMLGSGTGYLTGLLPRLLGMGAGGLVRSIPGMARTGSIIEKGGEAAKLAAAPAESALRRTLTGIPVGAASGVADVAAEKAVEAIAGKEQDPQAVIDELLGAGTWGAILGPAFEAGGAAAGKAYHALRTNPRVMPWLRTLEEGGGGTTALGSMSGLRPPRLAPILERRAQQAQAAGRDVPDVRSYVAGEAAPHIQRAYAKAGPMLEAKQVAQKQAYYATPEANVATGTDELLDSVMESYFRHGDKAFSRDPETAQLFKEIGRLSELQLVPRGARPSAGRFYRLSGEKEARAVIGDAEVNRAMDKVGATSTQYPGAQLPPASGGTATVPGIMPARATAGGPARSGTAFAPTELEATLPGTRMYSEGHPTKMFTETPGPPPTKGFTEHPAKATIHPPSPPPSQPVPSQYAIDKGLGTAGGFEYVLVPSKVTASELDDIIHRIDHLAKGEGKMINHAEFQRAARKVRDRFGSNAAAPAPEQPIILDDGTEVRGGWSALHHRQAEELSRYEGALKGVGLGRQQARSKDIPQRLDVEGVLQQVGDPSRAGKDKMLRELVEQFPEAKEMLRRVRIMNAWQRAQGGGPSVSGGFNPRSGMPYANIGGGADFLRFHFDPIMRGAFLRGTAERAGQVAASGAPAGTARVMGSDTGQPVTLEDLERLFGVSEE